MPPLPPSAESGSVHDIVERLESARFTVAFRGFEPREVQDFLREVAAAVREVGATTADAPAGAATAPPPVPTATGWGSGIRVAEAEQQAAVILREARAEADRILDEAMREAEQLRGEAQRFREQARASILESIRQANEMLERGRQAGPLPPT